MTRTSIIRLDYSGSAYSPSPAVKRALSASLRMVNAYPYEWYEELKKAIADYSNVKPENVLPTNGGDEAIGMLTFLFGKRVLIPAPTYGEYEYIAKGAGSQIRLKQCMADGRNYELRYTDSDLRWATLTWICNPNNPTGTITERERIDAFVEKAKGIAVVDEAYMEFCNESVADLIGKHRNLIVLRTFSKAFGLSGIRLGYLIANADLIRRLNNSKQEFNVNRSARDAGIAALKSMGYYRRKIAGVIRERDILEKRLSDGGVFTFKSNGGFVFIRFESNSEMRYVYSGLKKSNIIAFIASDPEFSGLHGPYMRAAIGTHSQMVKFAERLLELVAEYRK